MSNCPQCNTPITMKQFLVDTVDILVDDNVIDLHKWCKDEYIQAQHLLCCDICNDYSVHGSRDNGFVFCQDEDTNISGWKHIDCCPELKCVWCGYIVVKQKDRIKVEYEKNTIHGTIKTLGLFHKRCVLSASK